jgi:threonine aldolase
MSPAQLEELAAGCTRFFRGHYPQTVAEHLRQIAESPLALKPHDLYGRGGYISEFEQGIAKLLGKESAVFMPSGTMAQQIALRIWAEEAKNARVGFHPTCHLEIHEQMAYRELHHLESVLLGGPDRLFTIDDLKALDKPISTLLIELPQREIGGQLPTWEELTAICDYEKARRTRLHLDGARLWECRPHYDRSYAEIAAPFDSVYVSFYKILGGLPGAALAGPAAFIEKARVWQRRHGGNLAQQSPSVIAARLGMERHLPKIPHYVAKAQEIARILRKFPQVKIVPENPPTNMMHLYFSGDIDKLNASAQQIAREDKTLLFLTLGPSGKMEFVAGEATLDLPAAEIRRLFEKLFALPDEQDSGQQETPHG